MRNCNSEKQHNIQFGLETGFTFLGQSIRLNEKHWTDLKKYYLIGDAINISFDLKFLSCRKCAYACEIYSTTWSYSSAPGYSGHPRNSSAITHPNDHMSMASQNGNPSMISGALQIKQDYWIFSLEKKK